jgi:VWFA-related protein
MSTRRCRTSLALGVAIALVTGAGGARGAEPRPAAAPASLFGEEIDVRVVNVEVVVTDAKGERVSGLAAADFTLAVDGKPVPLQYFTEIREGRAEAAPPTGAAAGPDGLAPAAAVQPLPTTATSGTWYLVFVDDYFAIAPQRDRVLDSLRAGLDQLRPEDRMAIVAYDGGRLAQLAPWTGSRAALLDALDAAKTRPARGYERITERRGFRREEEFRSQILSDATPLDLNTRGGGLDETKRAYGITLIRQVQASAGAAVSAMRAFAQPPGRKVLLLLAGGWPFSARNLVTGGSAIPSQDLPEGDEVLKPLADTANLLGYTIYPVDLPGQQSASPDADAPSAMVDADALRTGPVTPPVGTSPLLDEQELEASLHFLAQQTGGRPLLDGDRNVALASTAADVRSFYWLGFVPSWRGDDRTHRIEVQVRRPGLRVRSRTGFLDLSRQAEVTMRLESALLLGTFPGALPMPMKLGPAQRTRRGQIEVPVTLGLPVDLMTVVPVDRQYAVKLELRFAASDGKGGTSQVPVVPITLSSEKPPTPGNFVRYDTKVTLRGPADRLVAAVYDPLSDKVATAEAPLAMP